MIPASQLNCGPDLSLLLECAAASLHGASLPRDVASAIGDKSRVIVTLAERHALTPLLSAQASTGLAAVLPHDVRAHLEAARKKNSFRNLAQTQELIRVHDALSAKGIETLCFKGPTLALSAFGDLALRQFSDLDILVRAADAERAENCLLLQGYQPRIALSPFWRSEQHRTGTERCLDHHDRQMMVDLHWRLIARGLTFSGDPETLFRDAVEIEVGGRRIATLATETLIPYLCGHSAKHEWSHLSFVFDIAALVKRTPSLDWEVLELRAASVCTTRMLLVGLTLAHRLAGIPLPPKLLDRMHHPVIASLVTRIVEKWRRTDVLGQSPIAWTYVRSLESPSDVLRYAFDTVIEPTHLEWALVSLPERLRLLYYPIRLGRLLAKHVLRPRTPAAH